jgi:hypothetical protein
MFSCLLGSSSTIETYMKEAQYYYLMQGQEVNEHTGAPMDIWDGVHELQWRMNQVPYLPVSNDPGDQCCGPSLARAHCFQCCLTRRCGPSPARARRFQCCLTRCVSH